MNWLNLNITTLDSPEFLGAEPVQRAAWLCLLRYCIGQENGGTIANCAGWKDRQWQQMARVTLDEVQQPGDLYRWEGDDVIVAFYPLEKEQEVKGKRVTAAANGKKGGRPRNSSNDKPTKTQEKPTLVNSPKAERERKGKELERAGNNKAPSSLGSLFENGADELTAANAVVLGPLRSQELQGLWKEWQEYRSGRATTGPKSGRKAWTAQAARMTAQAIESALLEHPERIVCDRIRTAIAGSWQGLNFDKLETGRASGSNRSTGQAGTPSSVPGINNRRGAAL
jgi:hypothetical protein